MPGWDELQREIRSVPSAHDTVRRKHLAALADLTQRNVIAYYSGWNEKGVLAQQNAAFANLFSVIDADKNGFMATINGLDKSKGLDLIMHTPGGNIAATESIVDYLRAMFGTDIRVIVPHLAMSAGTMIALSAREIILGKHSSLGPIDPQVAGRAAHGVLEEFRTAKKEIANDPSTIAVWQPIIAKYAPTLVGECEKATKWADEIVKSWLRTGMFASDPSRAAAKARKVVEKLSSHSVTLSHDRHFSADQVRRLGLNVAPLETPPELQEAVLTVHHAMILTLGETPAVKIIENHLGSAYVTAVNLQAVPMPGPPTAGLPPA